MTRAEHMSWCKSRALEYLPGNPVEAITSMLSDLGKHPETKSIAEGPLATIALQIMMGDSPADAKRFIEGFN